MNRCADCGNDLLECCGGMVFEGREQHRPNCAKDPDLRVLQVDGGHFHLALVMRGADHVRLRCVYGCDLSHATYFDSRPVDLSGIDPHLVCPALTPLHMTH